MEKKKIIVAITGASGAIYGQLLLRELVKAKEQFTHCNVVFSNNGKSVWSYELHSNPIENCPFPVFENDNYMAPFASGSAGYDAMIICPCTMGTVGRIASGISDSLITRAADVMLKERKTLILVPREAPYNSIHLQNMLTLSQAGAIICAASPSFYTLPASVEELALTIVHRIMTLAGITVAVKQWGSERNM